MSRASRAARWLAFGNRMKASAERRRVRSCQFVRLRIRARFPTRPSSLMRRRRPCRPRRQPKALSALQLSMSTSSSFSASIRARPTTGAPACRPRRRLRNSGAEKCTMRNPDRVGLSSLISTGLLLFCRARPCAHINSVLKISIIVIFT